jgi:hypothetical protein
MKLAARLALALIMAATSTGSRADDVFDAEAHRIAIRFVQLAGSEDNAVALVLALHHGVAVRLVEEDDPDRLPETIALEVPTGPMPWNEVRIALLHAQDVLLHAGVMRPHGAQLQAALVGGEVLGADGKPIALRGILRMRADGVSWVDIARVSSPPNTSPAFLGR